MAIDNPLEKIREITNEDEKDPLGGFLEAAGVIHPLLAIASVAKGLLDGERRWERIRAGLLALCDELMRMQERFPNDTKAAFESDWFRSGLNSLIDESLRSSDESRARLLGRAMARGCFPQGQDNHRQNDLAGYIKDLANLASDDIRFLKLLRDGNKKVIAAAPNLNRPDDFAAWFQEFKKQAAVQKFDPDDCVSLGARLSGFGLAYEIPRTPTRQAPHEHCFRPTKRGLYLLLLLEAAEVPVNDSN